MVTELTGTAAEENDNDPVEVREFEIQGSTLGTAIGYPKSPIWYDQDHFWRYFQSGMIVSGAYGGAGGCASVLYGPILEHYGEAGQFRGHLGGATSDVTTLPDGTSYAVFENGVVWVNEEGEVSELSPLTAGLVKSFGGLDPSIEGITQFAGEKVQALAENALATNSELREHCDKITTTLTFEHTGPGACRGAGFNSAGRSLPRSHVFKVHFDFNLTGCAGTFGGANADMHVTVRVQVNPPDVSAFMETYSIDEVGSPFGAGNGEIERGLTQTMNEQYGKDLIGKPLPSGFTVLAAIVDTEGNANVYIEPLCTTKPMLANVEPQRAEATVRILREVRDAHLARTSHGRDLAQIVEAFGPVFLAAVREQRERAQLQERIAALLVDAAHGPQPVETIAAMLEQPAQAASKLLAIASRKGGAETIERLRSRSVSFLEEELDEGRDLRAVLEAVGPAIEKEIGDLESHAKNPRADA